MYEHQQKCLLYDDMIYLNGPTCEIDKGYDLLEMMLEMKNWRMEIASLWLLEGQRYFPLIMQEGHFLI